MTPCIHNNAIAVSGRLEIIMAKKEQNKEKQEKARLANLAKQKERQYTAALKGVLPYSRLALVLLLVALLLFLTPWMDIYNSDIGGEEVSVSGWSCVMAALTGNYTSAGGLYGDMAVPFYYYAADYCEPLAQLALAAAAVVILACVLDLASAFLGIHVLHYASGLLSLAGTVLLILCFVKGISMAASDILPIYCSGNPACSIRSFALIPAIFTLVSAAASVRAVMKYSKAEAILK